MKSSVLYCFLLVALLFGFSCNQEPQNQLTHDATILADSLETVYAPDGRVALVDIKIREQNDVLIITGKTTLPEYKDELLTILGKKDIKVIDSLIVLPSSSLNGTEWGLINVSVANLRSQPGHSKELVTQALMGTPVKVLEKQNGWFRIQTPDLYLSWTESASIELFTQPDLEEWNRENRIIFMEDFGVIQEDPDENSRAVSDIVFGGIICGKWKASEWLSISLPDGRKGYIKSKSTLDFAEWSQNISPVPDQLIDLGYDLLGRPYLWGGTSTKGMDCSGFVKTLYFSGGLILSRDASQQVWQGDIVETKQDFSALLPGDLLFFGRKAGAKQKERITHVGLYTGNGEYIHSSGKVKLNSFDPDAENFSQYLVDIFVRAKRIVNGSNNNVPVHISNHPWYN